MPKKSKTTPQKRAAKHPALTHHTLEDRMFRIRARLIFIEAIGEANLLGLDVADTVVDSVGEMVRDCLKDVDAIRMLPGDVLNTLTPLKGGAR